MSDKNLLIVTRILGYYCAFYFGVKVFSVIQGNPYGTAQLILALLLFVIAFAAFYLLKKQRHNWGFAIFGVLLVSLLRYFEADLIVWLQGMF